MQFDHRFSYTIIGDPGVGKSCLEQQFTSRTFPEAHELTIGVEFGTRTITVHDKRIKLHIWDTAGHESYKSVADQCYYRAACIILVYDITRRETFDHIATWLSKARKLSKAGVTLVLIGNKCDLSHMRAVGYEEGRKFAKRHNLVFMEASAKTTHNVEEVFIVTAETTYKTVEDGVLDLTEKFVGFLHRPEDITASESGGVAGSCYGRSVGKTCLGRQFTSRTFPEVHDLTIGVEFGRRTINVDDKLIQLDIWDTAGHEAFVPITKQFYCIAACIILVYDITRRETFDHIATLLERARELSRAGVTLVLIGNKCDLSHMRAVSYEEGREFAKRHDLVFMEASAKTTQNVDEAFILTSERIYKKVQDGVLDLSEKVNLSACLVQYAGKAKDWLAIGWQSLASFAWHANMLDSQFLVQNGATKQMKPRSPNARFMQ